LSRTDQFENVFNARGKFNAGQFAWNYKGMPVANQPEDIENQIKELISVH
jgi:hypothetical protein